MQYWKNMKNIIYLLLVLSLSANTLFAGDDYKPRISGYMFGDFYYIAASHDSSIVGADGFWFRRIYLSYDQKIYENLHVRLRLEMASVGDLVIESEPLVPFVKDAYLRWRYHKNHELLLGISEPPTIRVIEKGWGYRYLEKTPLDLQRMAHSRDFGIAFRGKVDSTGIFKYNIMLANGSGNKSEINSGKKIMSSFSYNPYKVWTFEAYVDWNDNNGVDDFFTWQLFAAYKSEVLSLGLLYANQTHKTGTNTDYILEVLSAYATFNFMEKWSLIGRVDRNFHANPNAHKIVYIPFDDSAASTLFIAGIEFNPIEAVHLIPNVEIVVYDENDSGTTPGTEVIPRLTFFYIF